MQRCTTSLRMSCRMGRRNTRVPFILRKRVRSTGVKSVGGSKKFGVDGVSAGGTKSIPDW